ncbi:MAG: SDR family NAD(P)-dependent oxidoreductase [Sphingomonas sp.]
MSAADVRETYGPVALVTGASSGIGRAFAERLAAEGLDLVLVARRADRLEELAARLTATHGVAATPLVADLAAPDAADAIAAATAARDIGLVVSNAGYGMRGDHAGRDAAAITAMLMVNANAPLRLAHRFIPRLRARGRGGLLFTGSVEGLIGCPYSTAYAATKALVNALGEGLWGELTPDGIDVLTICPGATDTEAMARQGIDTSRFPHMMSPEAVADVALANIRNGPVLVASAHYQAMFDQLRAMPRREALTAMARSMRI